MHSVGNGARVHAVVTAALLAASRASVGSAGAAVLASLIDVANTAAVVVAPPAVPRSGANCFIPLSSFNLFTY